MRRAAVADDLKLALESGHCDQQSLEEWVCLLNFELLCRGNYAKVHQANGNTNHGPIPEDVIALESQWVSNFFTKFSECLLLSIHRSADYERELQARGLVACLELFRSQGSHKFDSDFGATVKQRFQERFQSLEWQRSDWEAPLSKEVFHQFQCSYLLCFGAEYARQFGRDEPITRNLITRGFKLVSVALSLASFSLVCPPIFVLIQKD